MQNTPPPSPVKHFYEELNLLRGLTILFIVYGHFNFMLGLKGVKWVTSWNHVWQLFGGAFLWGGSWFFVFISGFLFHAVFYQRGLIYKKFIFSKIKKVFCPYLIFATALLILKILYEKPASIDSQYLIYVYFYWAFWYVPFIMCVFLMTPSFVLYISFHPALKIGIFLLWLVIAIGVGRHNFNPILGCIYFIPAYLLGIIASIHYTKIISTPLQVRWTFFFIALMVLTCLVATGQVGETEFRAWVINFYEKPSYIIIIKLSFCIFFIWLLRWVYAKSLPFIIKPLNLLAKYSFTLFFFHQFPLFYLSHRPHTEFFNSIPFWPRQALIFFGSVAACFLMILLFAPLKKLLGRHSRMIIGS